MTRRRISIPLPLFTSIEQAVERCWVTSLVTGCNVLIIWR